MNHQPTTARRARTSGPERAGWAALPIITLLSLALAAGAAAAQTSGTTPSPFAIGMLSGLTGSTLTVQASNGSNRTVVVTGSTNYSQTTSATTSDLATGDCVRVTGTGSTTKGIQATSVAIAKPTSKGCTRNPTGITAGRGAGAGRFGSGRFGNRTPGGTPFTLPGGGTVPSNIAATFGSLTSVSGQQLSVKAQVPPKNKKSKPTTDSVTVTLTGSTTLTQTQKAAATNLASGSCVTASGTVDSLGTITAKTVTISQPVNGSCAGGFGGFGGFGGAGGFRGAAGGFGGGAGGGTPTSNSTT